jgi:competence protein ComEA
VHKKPVLWNVLLAWVPLILVAQPLEKLENCRFVPIHWADGDSFLVRKEDGVELTVRLYGADCIETHVRDESDARRLREQRRYFGISDAGGGAVASIAIAKQAGKSAADETARFLSRPFTVHTSFADARGDGDHKRIYGFVTSLDGEDLAEHLVDQGLARAFGVYRESPDGKHRDVYREKLRDLELRASKLGRGVWSHTNWEKLPRERELQRDEDAELGLATSSKKSSSPAVLDPNTAVGEQLMTLPGVGAVMAKRIIQGRPYRSIEDLKKVQGIGPENLMALRPFLRIDAK